MKSVIEQKAELLDQYIEKVKKITDHYGCTHELIVRYDAITAPRTLSEDPYIDEVLGTRLVNYLHDHYATPLRLSECPNISQLHNVRKIGTKSLHEYSEVMAKYGFHSKITV